MESSVRGSFRWAVAILVSLVLLALIGYVSLKLSPDWFAAHKTCGVRPTANCLDAKAQAEDRRAVTTATLALFAAGLGLFGAIYTARTFALNRETSARTHALDEARQVAERFTRAIDQLGSGTLDVRLGGIYSLERLARDSPDHHQQVIEVLSAYVRERARRTSAQTSRGQGLDEVRPRVSKDAALDRNDDQVPSGACDATEQEECGSTAHPTPATDVQAVLTVLGRRDRSKDRSGFSLDLAGADLVGLSLASSSDEAHLEGANLRRASLRGARLAEAHLEGAHLEGAHLEGAHLEGAHLTGAHLEGAHLTGAHLQRVVLDEVDSLRRVDLRKADLAGTYLEGMDFCEAHLEGAILSMAHLEGAQFTAAHLEGVELQEAHLERAFFWRAHLQGAHLVRAHLHKANFGNADLTGAHLTWAQLEEVDFHGANLRDAEFRDAHLEGAQLKFAADLDGADFWGVFYDDATSWPDGFPNVPAIKVDRGG